MKKQLLLLLVIFLAFSKVSISQRVIETDEFVYTIDGTSDFTIIKTPVNSKKVIYKAKTNIPSKGEKFYPNLNMARFDLIDDQIFIIYDVWTKSTKTRDYYLKLFNTNKATFSEPKSLYSTKINSLYSSEETNYSSKYSPDNSKVAVLLDNESQEYPALHKLTIYDTETFEAISSIEISLEYQDERRFIDRGKLNIDNSGNISIEFYLTNPKTSIRTRSFSASIPFGAKELEDIQELDMELSHEVNADITTHGRFYKTLQDYIDNNPIPGVRIKNGSFSWSIVTGIDFKLINDAGNVKKEDVKNLPSNFFTYKSGSNSGVYLIRLMDDKPYIVLVAGDLSYYALYKNQQQRYYSEGWNGELKKFSERALEAHLKKRNLFDAYKKDKPKREARDDVNDYFNKVVHWQIKYFNLLNQKDD